LKEDGILIANIVKELRIVGGIFFLIPIFIAKMSK